MPSQPRPSRERYERFVDDYRHRRLDDAVAAAGQPRQLEDPSKQSDAPAKAAVEQERRGRRRQYLRDYLRWL